MAHLAGMTLLVGSAALMDLRILGLARALPLAPLLKTLFRSALAGLLLIAPSGVVLFAADAASLAGSPLLQLKLALIAVALAGAAAFRLMYGDLDRVGEAPGARPPLPARALAGLSLALWPAAAVLGRLIGYE